jgi:Tfp pilus assembly protein PilF
MKMTAAAPFTAMKVPAEHRQVYERAMLLLERSQPNDVWAMISPLLSKNFSDPCALEILGHAAYQRAEWGLAANLYKQAFAIYQTPDVLINLGACFKQIDMLKEAEETWNMALEMNPPPHQRSGILANIAGCYTANGTPEKALKIYSDALKADPSNRTAYYNTCWSHMEMRNWAEGLRAYDSGFLCGVRAVRTYDGVEPLDVSLSPDEMRARITGKRVIVWGDQGLGDEIMAASCIPDVMKDAAEVMFDCHPRLVDIFSRSFGIECNGTRKSSNTEWLRGRKFDVSVPITTLMTIYRSGKDWDGKPYLRATAKDMSGNHSFVPYVKQPIGISWAGGVPSTRAHVRSMELKSLAPLLKAKDAEWYSLQYHESASNEVARLEESTGIHIKHFPGALLAENYDRTAELVASVDLVITVCTTVMHLAGAMGVPCWVMTPNRPPWVMGIEGDTMPMYNSVRLFRQTPDEKDWSGVINRISDALSARHKKEAAA